MISNFSAYRKDLKNLITFGELLLYSVQNEHFPEEFKSQIQTKFKKSELDDFLKKLPNFSSKYQSWYSEAIAVTKQLLPDRLGDLTGLYEKPKNRKNIDSENYMILDCLEGRTTTMNGRVIASPKSAIPKFQQQLYIVKSIKKRFDSGLFDIQQLVQADLFDSELEASKALCKKGFYRAAGVIAGVVLEKHLEQVSSRHDLKTRKRNPTINDFNQMLYENDVVKIKDFRFIQHLTDLRNLCGHNKEKEPEKNEILDMIDGVSKVAKLFF